MVTYTFFYIYFKTQPGLFPWTDLAQRLAGTQSTQVNLSISSLVLESMSSMSFDSWENGGIQRHRGFVFFLPFDRYQGLCMVEGCTVGHKVHSMDEY